MFRNIDPGRVVLEGKELHRVAIKIEPTNDYAQVHETLWFGKPTEDLSGETATVGKGFFLGWNFQLGKSYFLVVMLCDSRNL